MDLEKLKETSVDIFKGIRKKFDNPNDLKVEIGGLKQYKKGWKNIDHISKQYSFNKGYIDYDIDLKKKDVFPFCDNSVSLFYSEHVLEHFSNDVVQHILNECHRCLKKNGGLRIVVPDMPSIYKRYKNGDVDFFQQWYMSHEYKDPIFENAFLSTFTTYKFDDIKDFSTEIKKLSMEQFFDKYTKNLKQNVGEENNHINWFSEEKLKDMLKNSGFKNIDKRYCNESNFKEFKKNCFDRRKYWSMHIESIK